VSWSYHGVPKSKAPAVLELALRQTDDFSLLTLEALLVNT
jgi:hypothetical protein